MCKLLYNFTQSIGDGLGIIQDDSIFNHGQNTLS